jgi:hypothetical protein
MGGLSSDRAMASRVSSSSDRPLWMIDPIDLDTGRRTLDPSHA